MHSYIGGKFLSCLDVLHCHFDCSGLCRREGAVSMIVFFTRVVYRYIGPETDVKVMIWINSDTFGGGSLDIK